MMERNDLFETAREGEGGTSYRPGGGRNDEWFFRNLRETLEEEGNALKTNTEIFKGVIGLEKSVGRGGETFCKMSARQKSTSKKTPQQLN